MSRLRKEVEALTLKNKRPKDYDPEDELLQDEDSAESGSEQDETFGGREHYERVEKSKLREQDPVRLDSKYGGVAVSRHDLESSDSDPFAQSNGDEDEDEDPFAQTKDNDGNVSEEDSESEERDFSDDEGGAAQAGADSENEDESEEDETSEDDAEMSNDRGRRADLKALLSQQVGNVASGLAQATNADVKKGQAVKKQYQTFDRLLDARMKVQKGLPAIDEIGRHHASSLVDSNAVQALRDAQQAALALFNTMGSYRDRLMQDSNEGTQSKKRKIYTEQNSFDDINALWSSLTELEREALPVRQKTINKWSNKVKSSDPSKSIATSRSKLFDSNAKDANLTSVLTTYVINEQDKHFREHQLSDTQHADESSIPYDDNLFYQSLLRDLITTRATISSATNGIDLSTVPPKLHPSGNNQNGKRKKIDTKASKGRKIRYTVHEKLQNFMAAEGDTGRDTAMWTERGKDEFFGSLLGQDRALVENEDRNEDEAMDQSEDEDTVEIEALRLFRT